MSGPLRVAVVGLGGAGLGHIRYFGHLPGVEIAALCDPKPDLIAQRAKEGGLTPLLMTPRFEEILADPRIDIVSICTPDHEHCTQAVQALEAGKHVHVEKPMVRTSEECARLRDAVRRSGKIFGVHYQLRFFELYERIKQVIDRGAIGDVYSIEADYLHNFKTRTHGTSDWRLQKETAQPIFAGAGGCHFVDLMRWFLRSEVEEVMAYANHFAYAEYPLNDHVTAILKFRQGCIGKITVSIGPQIPKRHPTRILGTKGAIADALLYQSSDFGRPSWLMKGIGDLTVLPSRTLMWRALRKAAAPVLAAPLLWGLRAFPFGVENVPFQTYRHADSCRRTAADFVQAVRESRPPRIDIDEGIKTTMVGLAVEEALVTGRPVRVSAA